MIHSERDFSDSDLYSELNPEQEAEADRLAEEYHAYLEGEIAQLHEELATDLGKLVIAATRVDAALWGVFVDLSIRLSGSPVPSRWDLATESRQRRHVQDRLREVIGKRVDLHKFEGRADVLQSVFALIDYPPELRRSWEQWLSELGEVSNVRNRAVHDRWDQEYDHDAGEFYFAAVEEGAEVAVEREDVQSAARRLAQLESRASALYVELLAHVVANRSADLARDSPSKPSMRGAADDQDADSQTGAGASERS